MTRTTLKNVLRQALAAALAGAMLTAAASSSFAAQLKRSDIPGAQNGGYASSPAEPTYPSDLRNRMMPYGGCATDDGYGRFLPCDLG